jgi:predicted transcriptional regulator
MDWQTGLWGCEGRADAFELAGRRAEIVVVIREMGSAGIVEIAEAVGINKGTAYRLCAELYEVGKIVRTGTAQGEVRYALYEEEVDTQDSNLFE